MNSIFKGLSLAAALATALLQSPVLYTPAQAALLDGPIQQKSFPQCHDVKVLGRVVERFNWAEEKTWHRGIYLKDIERVRERRVQNTHTSGIPRRFCRGHARLTNGRHPTLFFMIEGGQGFAGNGFNVAFCIVGYDRWNEDNSSCRTLR